MEIQIGLSPNCSESVFRFFTLKPKKIQQILQIIADKVGQNYPKDKWGKQRIPLLKTAQEYDSDYSPIKYDSKEWNKHSKETARLATLRDEKKITDKEFDKLWTEENARYTELEYPKGSLIMACAGLGDNEAVVTIEKKKKAFRLNIGNNDIADDKGWVDEIKSLNIKVEEVETCKNLQKCARDCTCGIEYGF